MHRACVRMTSRIGGKHEISYRGCSQKRCTKGGDRVRGCITHLLSIKNSNVDGFHVSVVINI